MKQIWQSNDNAYTDQDLQGERGGMDLRTVAEMYNKNNSFSEFGVQGYTIPVKAKPEIKLGMKGSLNKYHEDIIKKPRDYIHRVI
jgi:hypothetical protein